MSESEAIGTIQNKFSEFKEYPNDNLPPQSIKTEKADDGWYVAFIQEGSGRPIIDARCFLVKNDNSILQREYTSKDDTIFGEFSVKECAIIENVIDGNSGVSEGSGGIVGGDEDEHVCKGSAGYSWCQEKQKCLRLWEESCSGSVSGSTCGLETCHGLDIVCGANPATTCTKMYGIGDKCLQYAKCGVQNGTCQQIQNPQFTECKFCVQKCLETSRKDESMDLFYCESQCK